MYERRKNMSAMLTVAGIATVGFLLLKNESNITLPVDVVTNAGSPLIMPNSPRKGSEISACYDIALPPKVDEEFPEAYSPLVIDVESDKSFPKATKDISGMASASTVRVVTAPKLVVNESNEAVGIQGGASGSGFAARNPSGETVIVTAGHVIAGAENDTANITVQTALGESLPVEDACTMFSVSGRLTDKIPEDGLIPAGSFEDIAVLKLASVPAKRVFTPLVMATNPPQKGDWLYGVNNNYRDFRPLFGDYTLVAMSEPRGDDQHFMALSGLDKKQTMPMNDKQLERARPGDSGGAILNSDGELVGILNTGGSISTDELAAFSVRLINLDAVSGAVPTRSDISSLYSINRALQSDRYRDGK